MVGNGEGCKDSWQSLFHLGPEGHKGKCTDDPKVGMVVSPGQLQLRSVGLLFFYAISCSFCARLRRVASSTGNLERKVTGRKKEPDQAKV